MKQRFILALLLIVALLFSSFALADPSLSAEVFVRQGGGSLNLRSEPSTSSASLGYIQHGQEVLVLSYGEEWSYIYVPTLNESGYLKSKYLINITATEEDLLNYIDYTAGYGFAEGYSAPVEIACDLDGDGNQEDLLLDYTVDSYGREQAMLTVHDIDGNFTQAIFEIESDASIWLARLDDSSRVYCFVSGDACSDDYIATCLYWNGDDFVCVPFLPLAPYSAGEYAFGGVESIQNNIITLCAHFDLLGTWGVTADYALMNGSLCPIKSYLRFKQDLSSPSVWEYRALTLKKPLTVWVMGEEMTLEVGSKLLPLTYNGDSKELSFITSEGITGVFQAERNPDEWPYTIQGIDESELFDNLCYAG